MFVIQGILGGCISLAHHPAVSSSYVTVANKNTKGPSNGLRLD